MFGIMPSYFWSGSCFFMDADGNGSQKEPSTRSVDEGAGKSEKDGPALTTGLSGGRVDAPESARGQAAVESKAEVPESVEDQGKNNAATTESVKREADLSQNMADSADMPEPLETKVPAERPQKPARKGLSPPCLLKELGLKVTAKGVLLPESRKTLLRRRRETRQALKNEADGAMVSTAVKRKPFACVSGAVQLDEVEPGTSKVSTWQYTHFISVPLAHDDKFRQLVDQFREDVVLQRFSGIDASIFMPSRRMHFTLCMLKLHSHAQVDEMKEALQDLSARLSATSDYARPVTANMKGLHIMTDDPTSVGVVYTTDRSSALQNRMNALLMSQRLLSSDGQHAEVKLHATLMNTKYARSRFEERSERETFDASVLMERFGQARRPPKELVAFWLPLRMKFRPCIDIHQGQVKQIVGGTLKEDSESLVTNFEASQPSSFFSELYKKDGLGGGHAIMLGASPENKATALEALKAYPGGLQVGGGINTENALEYLDAGASHVIVTSFVFHDGKMDRDRLNALVSLVGKSRLVLDLSCRRAASEIRMASSKAEGVMQLMAQAPSAWRDGQRKKLRKAIGGERPQWEEALLVVVPESAIL
eukprot:g27172.t2